MLGAPDEKSLLDQSAILTGNHGLAAVRIEGKDATAFLNAQATAAFAADLDGVQIAALADPKGRVLVVFRAWRTGDAWQLALAASEIEWLCAYLARFVLRARVHIAPAPETHLLGIGGTQAVTLLATAGLPAPASGELARAGPLAIAGLAGTRWLVAGEEMALADAARALAPHAVTGGFGNWKRARLVAGEVEIRGETRGKFLPQMLGLVELGAVSFRKGCYPGQEVIARTQHRGHVKRRLALLRLDTPLASGTDHEADGTRLEILDSVALPEGGALVQAVTALSSPE